MKRIVLGLAGASVAAAGLGLSIAAALPMRMAGNGASQMAKVEGLLPA